MIAKVSRTLWTDAAKRLWKDKIAILCLLIFFSYCLIAALAKIGWIATPWDLKIGEAYQAPSFDSLPLLFGTDLFGRSVFYKVIHGTRVAISVGLVSCLISVPVGVLFGAIAGYFGGWIDDLIVWFY